MPITLPQNTDYLEAIQTPQASFQDPELRQARPELDTIGLPRARSGNFADVYQLRGVPGKAWAVKCFTREAQDLQQRYHAIFNHLQQASLAFTVQFEYLAQGIRVKGQWYPIVKMSWVEGLTLSEFIKEHVDKPQLLIALSEMWIKLAQQLRKAGVAHGDLQHGNVMLISGTKASSLLLRLIDYDGMFVPALSQTRSGEVGHPNYQHPHRLRDGTYNGEVDRFAHLVIHCALRCLAVGGRQLWERYDNLDNLLFREKDFQSPATSPLFQDLWKLPDPAVRALVGRLLLASQMPLEQIPLLEDLAGAEKQYQLTPAQERQVQALLNARAGQVGQVPDLRAVPSPVQAAPAKPLTPAPEPPATDLISLEPAPPRAPALEPPGLGEREDKARRRRKRHKRRKSSSSRMRSLILGSMDRCRDLYAVISNNARYLILPLLFFVSAGAIGLVILLGTKRSTSKDSGGKRPELSQSIAAQTGKELGAAAVAVKVTPKAENKIRDITFVRLPKGKFWMGWDSEKKQSNQATIERDFEIAAYTVTQEQWQELMGDNPSYFSRHGKGKDKVENVSDAALKRFPVESVSWNDVQEFLKKLNAREQGRGYVYRLPKEAEWEYACRGGATSKEECSYDFYAEKPSNDPSWNQANIGPKLERTTKVGSYSPNKLGLYDMHGNVAQWCDDLWVWAGEREAYRVYRGGSWRFYEVSPMSSAAHRSRFRPADNGGGDIGFRLARVPSGSE